MAKTILFDREKTSVFFELDPTPNRDFRRAKSSTTDEFVYQIRISRLGVGVDFFYDSDNLEIEKMEVNVLWKN